ncbi:MAG: hypothetical protein EXS11_09255 [Gemmataceae bacterium]|nr:hypothetical protein [Gemmataceae bacterium]
MFTLLRNGVFLGLLFLISAPDLWAEEEVKVIKASIKAAEGKEPGSQLLTLTLHIASPFHIYANPVGLEDLENVQTTVKVSGKTALKSVKVDYPKGKLVKDKLVGDHSIYEGKVEIPIKVIRAEGDKGPLEVLIKFQACDEKRCLLPSSVKVELK